MADIKDVEQQIANDETIVDIPIYQKDGEPYLAPDGSPSTIGVIGSESKRYRRQSDELARRAFRANRGKPKPDEIRKLRIETAACAVERWHGWEKDGKPWACEPAHVQYLLAAPHILDQVEAGISEHASFFVKPSPS